MSYYGLNTFYKYFKEKLSIKRDNFKTKFNLKFKLYNYIFIQK